MVDELRALVRRDREDAEESDRLHRLDADVAELRARADVVAAFFAAEREEDGRLRRATDEAGADVARRDAEMVAAEAELARARNDTERTLAEQRVTRARDHRDVASQTLERAVETHAAFEREAAELAAELPLLERWAGELAAAIPGGTTPDDGDLADWASHARAELFVASSQVDARRELAVREANELASTLLGESTHGSTAEQALARVERYGESTPGQVSESR
jgi:hypothetical protein